MRIQHNVPALNTYRQLGINQAALAKNLEKLSSGYRINRAGDDAAGLAISEKMRAQIRGLETAQKNALDGISLIQTAEGALQEVHSMLNRMVELATMASNGVYDDQIDRAALNNEFQQLKEEIDRISQATNFNGRNLLDGTLALRGKGTFAIDASINGNDILNVGKVLRPAVAAVYTIGVVGGAGGTGLPSGLTASSSAAEIAEFFGVSTNDYVITTGGTGVMKLTAKVAGADANREMILAKALGNAWEVKGTDAYFDTQIDVGWYASDSTLIGKTLTVNGRTYQFTGDLDLNLDDSDAITVSGSATKEGNYAIVISSAADQDAIALAIAEAVQNVEGTAGNKAAWDALTGELTATANTAAATVAAGETIFPASHATTPGALIGNTLVTFVSAQFSDAGGFFGFMEGGGLNLQIGDTGDTYNLISVLVNDMSTKGLGIANLNISTEANAVAAVGKIADQGKPGTIKGAINLVSEQRGVLGALQNRLEHTINNLGVTTENLVAAESRIRDTDMAKEMMDFTRNSILNQAATAMLAQANMLPQSVLQLLQ